MSRLGTSGRSKRPPCPPRVILDRLCGFRLPCDVCFSPKPTGLLRGNEMTRRANKRRTLKAFQAVVSVARILTGDLDRKRVDRKCHTSRKSALESAARPIAPAQYSPLQAAHRPLGEARLKHSNAVPVPARIRRVLLPPCSGVHAY